MLDKAIHIAAKAHQGQVDKAGYPYILHPLRAMFSRKDETERICAVLHDVIEDTDVTFKDLRNEGFSEEVLAALDALTKRDNENYDEFIDRVLKNKIACHVKLADLFDNMDLSRIKEPMQRDYDRIEKYREAVKRITDALEEEGDAEFTNTKEIKINGCISVPEGLSEDDFSDKFIDFVENNNWSFGGSISVDEE